MVDMGDVHRREMVEEVTEQPPPLPEITNPVDDVGNESSVDNNDTEGVHQNAEDDSQHLVKLANVNQQNVVGFGVATPSSSVSTAVVTETQRLVDMEENVQTTSIVEEVTRVVESGVEVVREESGVEVIEIEYDSGEEEIVLDLGRFHSHFPHCPNCSHRITKVILLRKKINGITLRHRIDILRNYCLTVVRTTVSRVIISFKERVGIIAPHHDEVQPDEAIEKGEAVKPSPTVLPNDSFEAENGKSSESKDKKEDGHKGEGKHSSPTPPTKPGAGDGEVKDRETQLEGKKSSDETIKEGKKDKPTPTVPTNESEAGKESDEDEDPKEDEGEDPIINPWFIRIDHAKLLEILKCIVYGGLIESITSLSVVNSAAATDATTLNVFAIGLALLFSGIIVFGSNLMELKNVSSNKKYKELLGSKKNFLYHAILAIISYLIFGLIAPTTYAFAFRKSDNKDYKIVAVAAASFACIFLLAIAKAYVSKETSKVSCYIKTTRYYLMITVCVSGVSYVVGYMIEMFMLKFGWFKSVQRVTCFVPEMDSTWASY